MDFTRIEELVKIPKKGDAKVSDKNDYKTEIGKLLVEQGINDVSLKYLCLGFSFCGALPLYTYLNSLEKNSVASLLKSVFSYNQIKNNDNGIALRMELGLLFYFFTSKECIPEASEFLLGRFSRDCKSKDGGLRKDLSKTVEKNFVGLIREETKFLPMSESGVKDVFWNEFKPIMSCAISEIQPTKTKIKKQCDTALQWIGYKRNVVADVAELNSAPSSQTPESEKEKLSDAELIKEIESFMNEVPGIVTAVSQLLLKYKNQQKSISELQTYMNKCDSLCKRIEYMEDEAKLQLDSITKLTTEKHSLIFQLNNLQENNIRLVEENEKYKKVISVYSSDKTSSQSEQLNAIASKLKSEYRDFKDAEDMEMTVDLGENLRLQMQSIFRILAKAGIDVEGR